jgi:hypothetical protein
MKLPYETYLLNILRLFILCIVLMNVVNLLNQLNAHHYLRSLPILVCYSLYIHSLFTGLDPLWTEFTRNRHFNHILVF